MPINGHSVIVGILARRVEGMIKENRERNNYKKSKEKNYTEEDIRECERYFENEILNISKLKDDYDKFIFYAKKYAKYLKDNRLSTSQIRKVYSDIMNANNVMELKRLRPKLAYIQGRNKKVIGIQSFLSILDKGLERLSVDNREDEIKSLKEFAETIVAYRKYYGDKE